MVLIDSSSWTQALRERGDTTVRERVLGWLGSGEAAWCEMVRLELWNGARGTNERTRLSDFDRVLHRFPIDDKVWEEACRTAVAAREKGLTVPNADLLIFACAQRHGVTLDHCDKHFDKLEKLLAH